MAILKVAQMGHPVLRRIADPVDVDLVPSAAFQQTCEDLLETMDEYDGAGLAAPQVHLSIRLVVLTLDPVEGPEVWINPELTPLTDETAWSYEGCLSVEGIRGRVARPPRLHVRFVDRQADRRAYVLQGFPAVVAQHECDHLDGILYLDRADPRTLSFLPEFRRYGPMHRLLAVLDGADPDAVQAAEDATEGDWPDAIIEVPVELAPADALKLAERHLEAAGQAMDELDDDDPSEEA